MNGIIYCRVSTKEQAQGTSLESQKQACLEYADRKQIHVLDIFVEKGESAKFADRTQLLQLIDFCRNRKNNVGALIVWKIDRFARNVVDHFQIKTLLTKVGVSIHSVTEPIDAKPEGKLMETMLAGFAQFDNDIRALRSVGGMERKIQEGYFPWKPPLGYLSASPVKAKKTKPDMADPERFGIIQKGWRLLLSGVSTKADLVRFFGNQGLCTRKGKPISPQMVDRIVENKYYAGILTDPWSKEEFEGRHVPMVTVQEYYRVQEIISPRNRRISHQQIRPDFPLRAVLLCPSCQRSMTGSWSRGRSRKYAYYHCYFRGCKAYGKGFPKETQEKDFADHLRKLAPKQILLPRIEAAITRRLSERQIEIQKRQERYRSWLSRLEKESQELITMRRKGLISDPEFLKAKEGIDQEMASLSTDCDGNSFVYSVGKNEVRQLLTFLSQMPGNLTEMPIDFRRRFQQLIFPYGLIAGRFGTAKKSPIFEVIDTFKGANTNGVPRG